MGRHHRLSGDGCGRSCAHSDPVSVADLRCLRRDVVRLGGDERCSDQRDRGTVVRQEARARDQPRAERRKLRCVFVTPLLVFLIARYGFRRGMALALAAMVAVLIPAAFVALGRSPSFGGVTASTAWSRRGALHDPAFLSISIAFMLGFLAQVGFLTHQISYLLPIVGMRAAALAVSMTTVAAVVGRTVTGSFVDTVDRRLVACANLALQAAALAVLVAAESSSAIYVGCVLFGVAVGNMNTLPALIVQREFPPAHFSRVVSLVVSVNHLAFALGPVVLGALHDWSGDYRASFLLCIAVEVAAAVVVLLGRRQT